MKVVLSVVGARPQFIKAAPLSRRLRGRFSEVLLHTGQHYDRELSGAFFEELDIPVPDVNLGVGSAGHAEQTARMRAGIAAVLEKTRPDVVVVFGDTNSTLAGALAASECGTPLVHVEAGLRSFNRSMAEEVNRIVADHLSDLCLAPTPAAMSWLAGEGLGERSRLVGDVMLDSCLAARDRAGAGCLERLGVEKGGYCLATVHRAENTDRCDRLEGIISGFAGLSVPVVFPVHPRTVRAVERQGASFPDNVIAVEPVSYLETIALVAHARAVLTDSGGLQKEAFFLSVPCVTLRDETEWPETVEAGWNVLAGTDPGAIRRAVEKRRPDAAPPDLDLYGGGRACERIVEEIAGLV